MEGNGWWFLAVVDECLGDQASLSLAGDECLSTVTPDGDRWQARERDSKTERERASERRVRERRGGQGSPGPSTRINPPFLISFFPPSFWFCSSINQFS